MPWGGFAFWAWNGGWHDRIVGRGHAGERKMSCGMTGTPERGKVRSYSGASPPAESDVHPGKGKLKKFQW